MQVNKNKYTYILCIVKCSILSQNHCQDFMSYSKKNLKQATVYSNIISNRNVQIKNKLTCLFAKLDISFVSNDSALTT